MLQVVWIVVGIGVLLLLAVLGYGLFGQLKRLRSAITDAQAAAAARVPELIQGIRRAQRLRMQDGTDPSRGTGRHA